ncbi:hypothetical protein JCM19233_1150 [Vibrio astriarenae]|nr:hypothetical protein JCM19233_1150 [Vibrio sp. C7]
MSKLTIVANIIAKQDKVELVKAELLKLIDVTRAEEGCINYDLHQDNENPAHFMFYETGRHVSYGSNIWVTSILQSTWQRRRGRLKNSSSMR